MAKSHAEEVKPKRRPKPKVKMSELRDVVDAEGKLIAKPGDKVYFERIAPKGKIAIHEGVVKGIDAKGLVEIWDETIEQFYCFSLHQRLPVVKML